MVFIHTVNKESYLGVILKKKIELGMAIILLVVAAVIPHKEALIMAGGAGRTVNENCIVIEHWKKTLILSLHIN